LEPLDGDRIGVQINASHAVSDPRVAYICKNFVGKELVAANADRATTIPRQVKVYVIQLNSTLSSSLNMAIRNAGLSRGCQGEQVHCRASFIIFPEEKVLYRFGFSPVYGRKFSEYYCGLSRMNTKPIVYKVGPIIISTTNIDVPANEREGLAGVQF